jgi:hypothetical protein
MAQHTFPPPTAEEQRIAGQPQTLITGIPVATEGMPPAVLERLLQVRERADNFHRMRPPAEERVELGLEKAKAEQWLRKLQGDPGSEAGFRLHPQDKRVLAQKALIADLTAQLQRLNARTERATALWQPAARVRQNCETWLKQKPQGTAVEDAPAELPKLNGKETLLDGIEKLRRRGRELQADAHRIRSGPYPSSWAKEQARAQVAALAQRGAPNVTLLVEHGRAASRGRCKACGRKYSTRGRRPSGSRRRPT